MFIFTSIESNSSSNEGRINRSNLVQNKKQSQVFSSCACDVSETNERIRLFSRSITNDYEYFVLVLLRQRHLLIFP